MSESSQPAKWRAFFGEYPAPIQSALIAITSACLIHEGLGIILHHLLEHELPESGVWFLAACGAYLLERAFHISYEGKTRFMKFMEATGLAAPIIESLHNIQSQPYSRALERHFIDQNLPRQVSALFAEWRKRIVLRHKWRLVFERHLSSEVTSITGNSLSLPLDTYLKILSDFIGVSMEEANDSGRKLVIRSFTNARPKDWFEKSGAPRAAAALDGYRTNLQQVVARMRTERHAYRRHVLCSSTLSGYGFSDGKSTEKGWLQLTPEERERYYSVHTDGRDGALYVELDDDITFCENHTEYIYFGFQKGKELFWEWCFCCLYTNNNLNVSASFVDMSSETEATKLVIDTPNAKNRNLRSEFYPPPRLQVNFKEFPDVIDRNSIGKVKPFRSVAPLAEKWHRASLIWHDSQEARVLTDYLGKSLNPGASILDCACGTGFHSTLLAKAGFAVMASDVDEGNIRILKDLPEFKATPFNAEVADWRNLQTAIKSTFDCVLCLGSSITYYDSWKEDAHVKSFNAVDLEAILQQMRSRLNPGGILVIGVSRHYSRHLQDFTCTFREYPIGGISHGMRWHLAYDWDKGRKHWLCEIWNEDDEDYSFDLSSYLFDAHDLKDLCERVFGLGNVSIEDIDSGYYDTLVVSKNP